jgi:hypothetical protein
MVHIYIWSQKGKCDIGRHKGGWNNYLLKFRMSFKHPFLGEEEKQEQEQKQRLHTNTHHCTTMKYETVFPIIYFAQVNSAFLSHIQCP